MQDRPVQRSSYAMRSVGEQVGWADYDSHTMRHRRQAVTPAWPQRKTREDLEHHQSGHGGLDQYLLEATRP